MGTMAKGVQVLLCALLLATLANCGLGLSSLDSQGGTIYVVNNADYNMTLLNKVHYVDGHTTVDPAYTPLPKSTVFGFQVMPDMDTVTSMFRMPTNAAIPSYQVVVDWSSLAGAMKVPCLPNCFWVVDNRGFSVASSEYGLQTFVIGWD